MKNLLTLTALAVMATAALAGQAGEGIVAFVNVNVVPMDRERLLSDHTVIVHGNRITDMGPSASVKAPEGATRVDGKGRYLMPTIAEMHAHVPGGQAPDEAIERVLLLYRMNGIGTIRSMLGHPRHLPLRDRIAKGDLVGPTLYTSGPSFNGNSAPTQEAAIKMVQEQKAAGYDFLKIHPGIKRDVYDALVETAKRERIRWAGHVPADVGLFRALEAGQATIDHLDGYVEALVKDGIPATASQTFGLNLIDQVDESKIPKVVTATKVAGAAVVPTEVLLENWVDDQSPDTMASWPEMKYAQPGEVQKWIENKKKTLAAFTPAQRKRFVDVRRRLIKALHAAGVPILLGSDAPQIWNVPGFSIHRELQTYVASGLTPYQALETGTRNVAVFFKTERETGTVATGKRADLLLLDANPLADVANTSKIAGVMVRGRWQVRGDIEKRLN